jgi:hypothetical protein
MVECVNKQRQVEMSRHPVDPAYLVLDNFLRSLPGPMLKCRARHGHRFPDWTDTHKTRAYKERHSGVVMLEADCEEGCGTFFRKLINPDGFIEYSSTGKYEYEEEYKLPPECRMIPTREILAAARVVNLSRRPARTIKTVDELPIMKRRREREAKKVTENTQVIQFRSPA